MRATVHINGEWRTSMRNKTILAIVGAAITLAAVVGYIVAQPELQAKPVDVATPLDRTVLPIAEPDYPHATELDARNAKAPPRFEVKAPKGAPNVIVFLIDDIGFGHASTFGGPIPHADARAAGEPADSSTTASTPRRSARRRAWPC